MKEYIALLLEKLSITTEYISIMYIIIVAACILLIFYGTKIFCHRILIPLVGTLTSKTSNRWDDILLNKKVLKNICELIPPILLTILLPILFTADPPVYFWGFKILWIYITAVSVKLTCSLLSSLYTISNEHEKMRNQTLQGVFQMLKLVAICIGGIIIISILIDKNPGNILAGLGASAAVLMLVFKDSIMGLVAGVQLSANDMLRPGDWITLPKHGADGMVIDVTLTTVKVQNWDKTITTIPPYLLVSDSFQNWRAMFESGGRRIKRSVHIDMNTIKFCTKEEIDILSEKGWLTEDYQEGSRPINLHVFRRHLERYLKNHPGVNKEMTLIIRQLQPTSQGLPLELYFFSANTQWIAYEYLQAEIFEYFLAILPEFGLKAFQSPAGTDISRHL